MNEVVKEKWVKALRSGEYKQTIGKLSKEGKYCCLGVLCDLYEKETHSGEWEPSNRDDKCLVFKAGGVQDTEIPPIPVVRWAGFKSIDDLTINRWDDEYALQGDLVDINDSGNSFETIADLIEEYM